MTNIAPINGGGDLLSRHYRRLLKSRGTFGSWQERLFDLSPRWQWYSQLLLKNTIPRAPWPHIHFVDDDDHVAGWLVASCLKGGHALDELLKYVLHMLGHPRYHQPPSKHFDFDLEKALTLHRDLFGDYYSEEMSHGLRSQTGYFPTPMSICNLIADMTLDRCDLLNSVHDPCVGSGRMLMAASNRSLFLSGIDVNPVCVRMTFVNGYLFAPQLVIPPPPGLRLEPQRRTVIPREMLHRLSAELKEAGHGKATPGLQLSS